MNLRALAALQTVALPIGYSVLDAWRLALLAVLVMLTFFLIVWTHQLGREYTRNQAAQRLERLSQYRAQQEKLAAQAEATFDTRSDPAGSEVVAARG